MYYLKPLKTILTSSKEPDIMDMYEVRGPLRHSLRVTYFNNGKRLEMNYDRIEEDEGDKA